MEPGRVPALLEALFVYVKAEGVDKATKAALGLCNKHFKNLADATVVEAWIDSDDLNLDLNALLNTKWHGLAALYIWESNSCQKCQTELPSALFVKFSRLETLVLDGCVSLKALPTEIGDLQHLKVLIMHSCHAIKVLPSSLGQLTTLEEIQLDYCGLTTDGLAPLQHLTGLTTLDLANNVAHGNLFEYPDFICNLTSLKELILYSDSITTLPDALGNLTNLESLTIRLDRLEKLHESIGNLNALKEITFVNCCELTALPESFDDLLWRKAHEKETIYADFLNCPKLVFSNITQNLDTLEQNGVFIEHIASYV